MSEADPYPNRTAITVAMTVATLMNTLDQTIGNVALPHIQGSLSAASDEVVWVLTSYIVSAAMITPVTGWLANRFGIKRVLLITVGGFTAASILCGLATSLPELVLFRIAQGAFGAFTLPIGQTVLFTIYPPSQHAKAMSIWSMGSILGPLAGPVVGGYLTETLSWRWCFFINLPLGVLSIAGIWAFMNLKDLAPRRRFDFLGFATLITSVGCLQLMLDRGPGQDWFGSREIWTYALTGLISVWVFLAHTATTRTPFIDLAIFRDKNMVSAAVLVFITMSVIFGAMALQPLLTQSLMGYPVLLSGLVNTPRGVSMMVAMAFAPRLASWFDPRLIVLTGILCTALALWQMAHFDLSMGQGPLIVSSFWQGLGQGLMFVPISTLAFSTLSATHRAEAAAVFNLIRNIGASVGISALQALAVYNGQAMHAAYAAKATPTDPMFGWALDHIFSPATLAGAEALNAEITRQATMVAYVDDFRLMFVATLCCIPFVLLLRVGKTRNLDLKEVMVE
jgi:DHA2 family multidrug resistance protein